MFEIFDSYGRWILVCGLAIAAVPLDSAVASNETVLYSFCSQTHCFDGQAPRAGLIADRKGNFYSTTYYGGSYNYGTVFKLAPNGTETALYSFQIGSDGFFPVAGLIRDSAGDLYGTTEDGGTGCVNTNGCGTVFKLAPNGTETVLYAFTNGSDGGYPKAGVIMDKMGNLYNTTFDGGADAYGTVFKLAADGTETVLHSFTGSDGQYPDAGLIMDKKGNLYGTTVNGGTYGYGTVFELAANGTETVLYAFTNGSDGGYPEAGLVMDQNGALYGTTDGGANGYGTVFKLAPSSNSHQGTETVLYAFTGGSDGRYPEAGLIVDKKGNLYGTTFVGGADNYGTVFKLAPNGTETVLYAFTGGSDGGNPWAGLIADKKGNLYGTTYEGGAAGGGTVFEIKM